MRLYLTLFLLIIFQIYAKHNLLSAQNFKNPRSYNDFITNEQLKIMHKNVDYLKKSIYSTNAQEIQSAFQAILDQINTSRIQVQKMPSFQSNSQFKNEVILVFKQYQDVYQQDFQKIHFLKKESSLQALKNYYQAQNEAEEKLVLATQRFQKAQKQFADTYQLVLVENPKHFSQDFSHITQVNKYIRQIQFAYLQTAIPNAYFWEATNQRDVQRMEKQRKNLAREAAQARQTLNQIKNFPEGKAYLNQTKQMIDFFLHQTYPHRSYAILVEFTRKQNQNALDSSDAQKANDLIQKYTKRSEELLTAMKNAQTRLFKQYLPK